MFKTLNLQVPSHPRRRVLWPSCLTPSLPFPPEMFVLSQWQQFSRSPGRRWFRNGEVTQSWSVNETQQDLHSGVGGGGGKGFLELKKEMRMLFGCEIQSCCNHLVTRGITRLKMKLTPRKVEGKDGKGLAPLWYYWAADQTTPGAWSTAGFSVVWHNAFPRCLSSFEFFVVNWSQKQSEWTQIGQQCPMWSGVGTHTIKWVFCQPNKPSEE